MIPLEAALTVGLTVEAGRVAAVSIESSRRPLASRLLAGRAPEQVCALLPTVFSLCGTAQGLAAAQAVENVLGLGPIHPEARALMLAVETVAEHLLGMARDWPALLDEPPDLAAAKGLRPAVAAARKALYPDGDWHRPGGGHLAPDETALAAVTDTLRRAAATLLPGIAARLLARVETDGLAEFGASDIPPLPAHIGPALAERLAADPQFAVRPTGIVYETGPLARHPQGGNGLLARLRARVEEIKTLLAEMPPPPASPGEGWGGGPERSDGMAGAAPPPLASLGGPPPLPSPGKAGGGSTLAGIGAVQSPRGLLVHWVRLEGGAVADLRILAPTEWNFHPAGPLVRGLLGTPAGEGLEWRARLLCHALDPCVACTIRVE